MHSPSLAVPSTIFLMCYLPVCDPDAGSRGTLASWSAPGSSAAWRCQRAPPPAAASASMSASAPTLTLPWKHPGIAALAFTARPGAPAPRGRAPDGRGAGHALRGAVDARAVGLRLGLRARLGAGRVGGGAARLGAPERHATGHRGRAQPQRREAAQQRAARARAGRADGRADVLAKLLRRAPGGPVVAIAAPAAAPPSVQLAASAAPRHTTEPATCLSLAPRARRSPVKGAGPLMQ